MALVIMKFNLYNCMIAANVMLLSCFSFNIQLVILDIFPRQSVI